MTTSQQEHLDGGYWPLVVVAFIALVVANVVLFHAVGGPSPTAFETATEQTVTNCSAGAGCGTLPLLIVTSGVLAVTVIGSAVYRGIAWWRRSV